MNNEYAIIADQLSKVYSIGNAKSSSTDEALQGDELWALKDVSFKVKKGESVGIIGPNGSGKSTLLKILASVTHPSSGDVFINGRLASILDIGAGFHPELSGRENVYLNGQILGFTKDEIKHKYNEIIAFSGIENFIEEPVKKYSNGMYLRLAFSIMAHLDFDIYLFDEVLAVGDAAFQHKVKEKIKWMLNQDKTMLYVSHSISEMDAMDRFFLFDKGKLKDSSYKKSLVKNYFEESIESVSNQEIVESNLTINDFVKFNKSDEINIRQIKFFQEDNPDYFVTNKEFVLEIEYEKLKDSGTIDLLINILDQQQNVLMTSTSFIKNEFSNQERMGVYIQKCIIPDNIFFPQTYWINLNFVRNANELIPKNIASENINDVYKNDEVERALSLDHIIAFKTVFHKNNKKIDISNLNLRGQLLAGFNWLPLTKKS